MNRCGEASHHPRCLMQCVDRADSMPRALGNAKYHFVRNKGYVQNFFDVLSVYDRLRTPGTYPPLAGPHPPPRSTPPHSQAPGRPQGPQWPHSVDCRATANSVSRRARGFAEGGGVMQRPASILSLSASEQYRLALLQYNMNIW
jgi:hypothetical protein